MIAARGAIDVAHRVGRIDIAPHISAVALAHVEHAGIRERANGLAHRVASDLELFREIELGRNALTDLPDAGSDIGFEDFDCRFDERVSGGRGQDGHACYVSLGIEECRHPIIRSFVHSRAISRRLKLVPVGE